MFPRVTLKTFFFCCLIAKSCSTLWDPIDCSPPGSSVHGISQARILEWVTLSFSRRSSQPKEWTHISYIGRWVPYHWATSSVQFSSVIQSCPTLQPHELQHARPSSTNIISPQNIYFFLRGSIQFVTDCVLGTVLQKYLLHYLCPQGTYCLVRGTDMGWNPMRSQRRI